MNCEFENLSGRIILEEAWLALEAHLKVFLPFQDSSSNPLLIMVSFLFSIMRIVGLEIREL